VAGPLNLTMQSYVENEGRMSLDMALQGQLSLLKSRGFESRIVYTDPQSTFRSMTQEFLGTEIDVGEANDHVAKVDVKIRRIKETTRKVKAGLPWELPGQLFKDLVTYAVSWINIRRMTALSENVCPRVLFMGMPIAYKRELLLAYCDCVEAYKGTMNNMAECSAACIALYPAANSTGSWVLWKIDTRCKVRRSNVVKLVTTDAIITTMNATAEEDTLQARNPQSTGLAESLSRRPTEVGASQAEEPGNNPDETQGRNHKRGEDETKKAMKNQEHPQRKQKYALATKVARSAWEEQAAKNAIEKELWQLIEELVAIVPVK
jgi:ribonuclease HI